MAKDKERSINPAAAQRKQDKQKFLKKGKAEALARRNEKLARRNPERIQRQINDLKSIEESGQRLRPRDKELLEALEKDLRAVQKAREALGDKAPKFAPFRGGYDHEGGEGGEGTTYEAKPEIRDLRQEAVSRFIPAAVRAKQDSIRGHGKLLEPEEMDRLEKAGYHAGPAASAPPKIQSTDADEAQRLLDEEEARFREEMKTVQIEEVPDEDL
ncbi:hypothetical protein N7470_007847 [Penicillium chermesinum]|nr:hypothetical protein N7470_007847 [Penicillium chermesinum]